MGLRSRSFFAGVSVATFAVTVASGVQANDSVVKAVSDPNGWAIAGHDYANTRFSPLKQITSENVGKLQLAYSLSLASLRSNESSPVVIGDTLYVTTSWGPKYVYSVEPVLKLAAELLLTSDKRVCHFRCGSFATGSSLAASPPVSAMPPRAENVAAGSGPNFRSASFAAGSIHSPGLIAEAVVEPIHPKTMP